MCPSPGPSPSRTLRPGSCSTAPTRRSPLSSRRSKPIGAAWGCASARNGRHRKRAGPTSRASATSSRRTSPTSRWTRCWRRYAVRDVAIVSFAQSIARAETERNEVEILMPVVQEARERSGIPKEEIGFTCSGSADFLAGQPFAFVSGLEAIGAWPPIRESHVEMDGAWALYEAWVMLQTGEFDSALVYGFGKASMGSIRDVLALQLDPYVVAPLWPDAISLAALQARAVLEGTGHSER